MRPTIAFLALFASHWPGAALAQGTSSFVPMPPCRLVDTRLANGLFGGPVLSAGSTRTFNIPASSCNIPSSAVAYSLNITVIPSGPNLWVVIVWPAGQPQPVVSTMNDPAGALLANAAIVPAGTNGGVNVWVSDTSHIILDINGYFLPQSNSTSTAVGTGASNAGVQNTALGFHTLQVNLGTSNTAIGSSALTANSLGNNNTSIGANSLFSNVLGSANTSLGGSSLLNNIAGNDNTAMGFSAMSSNATGSDNVAAGESSLLNNINGSYNVGIGSQTLYANTSGSGNIALGYQAGNALTTGNSNIDIGNPGVATDSGVIRIGSSISQSSTYIAGIVTSPVSGVPVIVNSSGQLGVQTSSQRFKQDIRDIGDASDALMQLRPVMFRYRAAAADGSQPEQYGLIAEEVEKIFPELVLHDVDGQPLALAYQQLPALLLNELQKQQRTIEEQKSQISDQQKKLEELSERLSALERAAAKNRQ